MLSVVSSAKNSRPCGALFIWAGLGNHLAPFQYQFQLAVKARQQVVIPERLKTKAPPLGRAQMALFDQGQIVPVQRMKVHSHSVFRT